MIFNQTIQNFKKILLNPQQKFLTKLDKSLLSTCTIRHFSANQFIYNSGPNVPETGKVTGVTFPEFLFSDLDKWSNAIAFECGVSGRKYTHGQLYGMMNGFATSLLDMTKPSSLKKGQVVAVVLPNLPEYPAIILAILHAGLVASPMNPLYTPDEFGKLLKISETKVIITMPQLAPLLRMAGPGIPIITIGGDGGDHKFEEMVRTKPKPDLFLKGSKENDDHLAILPFSSGTTGPPKGVEITHSNLSSNLEQQLSPHFSLGNKYTGGNPQDRLLGILPFFHIFGLNVVMTSAIKNGGCVVTLPKFDPAGFLDVIRKNNFRFTHLVPPLLSFLVNHPDLKPEDLKSIEAMVVGAAPVGVSLIKKLNEKADREVLFQQGYGMTELSPVSHMLSREFGHKIGSVGRCIPSTLAKITSLEDGKTIVGPGIDGEICIKGPQVMRGYFKNQKATDEIIDKEGWLHTGDIGHHDEEGCLFLVDRLKELIKVKGLQVAPAELEDLLRHHPDVLDVAVIGVDDERSGELPRAYIVKRKPDSPTKEGNIQEFVKGKVSAFKELGGGVEFVKEIPKSAAGKILRKDLRKDYKEKHGKK